jgi:hypothetical protein
MRRARSILAGGTLVGLIPVTAWAQGSSPKGSESVTKSAAQKNSARESAKPEGSTQAEQPTSGRLPDWLARKREINLDPARSLMMTISREPTATRKRKLQTRLPQVRRMQEPTRPGFEGRPKLMESYETSIHTSARRGPDGVLGRSYLVRSGEKSANEMARSSNALYAKPVLDSDSQCMIDDCSCSAVNVSFVFKPLAVAHLCTEPQNE